MIMRKGILGAFAVMVLTTAVARAQDLAWHREGPPEPERGPAPTPLFSETPGCPGCGDLGFPCEDGPHLMDCGAAPSAGLRTWASIEYLLWWIRSGPVATPLLATG